MSVSCAGLFALSGCGGGGSSGAGQQAAAPAAGNVVTSATSVGQRLEVPDVKRVLAQGIDQADALGAAATIVVVDRVGNVLGTHRMAESAPATVIGMAAPPPSSTGLEGVALPTLVGDGDKLAATAKALTAAYLSSGGNAFSTRTAGQIVQKHFNPGERDQPGGPLFGVQFSQLPCSDFAAAAGGGAGPRASPLGLAADPGGFPLYKDGVLVGGVGAMADGRYSIDADVMDFDQHAEHRNVDEQIALAATFGFSPAPDIRADRITLEGKTLRFTDVEFDQLATDPASTPDYEQVLGGIDAPEVVAGKVFGQAESGIRAERLGDAEAFVFVAEDGANRYPPKAAAGAGALSVEETRQLLASALAVADRARSQIRRPLGTSARVTVSVVDAGGEVLGMARSADAPVFGADVSLQKARTAALFSSADAATFLAGMPAADYSAIDRAPVALAAYVDAAHAFIAPDALSGSVAFTSRAIGNLSRPNYPDGIEHNPNGPFSKSPGAWSVFSTGLQLDLSFNGLLGAIAGDAEGCAGAGKRAANGIQIFPGGVPIYRERLLIGAIGVSGDGVDQDDMVGFLGIHEAGEALGTGIGNAPPDMRADMLAPQGERLRYVQCPQSPFLDSDAQNVCWGK